MAQSYVFMTDSDSDLPFSLADQWQVPVVQMPYTLDGVEYLDDNGRTEQGKVLFERLRAGAKANTSLLPAEVYLDYFEPILREKDLLFIAFSSKMSNTIQNIFMARETLLKKYPERKMTVVDTLSISVPMTLILQGAHKLYQSGASMEEVEQWVLDNRMRANTIFTVDDLMYLKRGGRISTTQAAVGSLLDLKPILVMGRSGRIEPESKVQGRKKAMRTMVEKMVNTIEDAEHQEIVVLHGDSEEAAQELAGLVRAKIPDIGGIAVRMVGPVIGVHAGPGTLGLAYMGKERTL